MEKINIKVNGESMKITPGSSAMDLLLSLQIEPEQVAVAVNDNVLANERLTECYIKQKDEIEIIQFLGGG